MTPVKVNQHKRLLIHKVNLKRLINVTKFFKKMKLPKIKIETYKYK